MHEQPPVILDLHPNRDYTVHEVIEPIEPSVLERTGNFLGRNKVFITSLAATGVASFSLGLHTRGAYIGESAAFITLVGAIIHGTYHKTINEFQKEGREYQVQQAQQAPKG